MSGQKSKYFVLIKKNSNFTSKFNPFQCLSKNSNQQGPIWRKKVCCPLSLICHLLTFGPGLRESNEIVHTELFLMDFWQRMSKLALTSFCSAKPSNKKEVLLQISSLLYLIFLITLRWWWLPHPRTQGGSYVCEAVFSKIQNNNLENQNMPRFLHHWRFLSRLLLWLLLVNFQSIGPLGRCFL